MLQTYIKHGASLWLQQIPKLLAAYMLFTKCTPAASCIPNNQQTSEQTRFCFEYFLSLFFHHFKQNNNCSSYACIFDDGQNRTSQTQFVDQYFPQLSLSAFFLSTSGSSFYLSSCLYLLNSWYMFALVFLLYNMLAAAATNSTHKGNGKYKINFSNNLSRQRIS